MRRGLAIVMAGSMLAVGACGGGTDQALEATPRPEVTPAGEEPGVVRMRFSPDAEVSAEVVADDAGRQQGLMDRESLEADAGMLFLFAEPNTSGFWMKNTLIPLSIAFMRRDGDRFEVVAVLDMQPCEQDPCRIYEPGATYDAALEVNLGWFGDHGVEVGAVGEVQGELPTPS